MRRREFISLLGGAVAIWPLAARAQQKSEIPRIGFVYQGSQAAMANRLEGVLSGLRDSGYAAPAQVEIVARAAEGDPARIAPLVAEVIAKNASVIMASGPLVLNAARSATRTIPIVAIDLENGPGHQRCGSYPCATRGQHHWRIPRFSRLHGEVDGDSGRMQSKALPRRRTVGSRHRTRAIGFGSESRKNAECPIRGRRGAPSFRFRCRFLEGKPTRGRRNGDAVISADRSKRASSCRTRSSSPPSSHYAFS